MFNIASMILLLFILFGILVITVVVWIAGEEVEILHEMPDIDSSIFKHELSEWFTLVPFCFMLIVLIVNISLMTTESVDEIWFYMKNDAQGIKILNAILAVYIIMLATLCYILQTQEEEVIEIRHIIANVFGLLQALAMQMHAKSKLTDAE